MSQQVSMELVKQLRTRTGAGIVDCRNALAEAGGDEEEAVKIIQKKGLAKVAKKAGAIAADGAIHAYIHPGSRLGVLLEVNCQTDFVARSEDFRAFVTELGMQIASMVPQFVRREEIGAKAIADQRELFAAQMAEEDQTSGKSRPAQVADKILQGKIDKWMTESCLMEQISVLDNETTIARKADELSAKLGEKISIRRFTRLELGEGIEKKRDNLADEVAKTLAGA